MKHKFTPQGVCAREISFAIDKGMVCDIHFRGGCPGNLQAIAKLAQGKPAAEIAQLLSGIKCDLKSTSCPDQLARALKDSLQQEARAQ